MINAWGSYKRKEREAENILCEPGWESNPSIQSWDACCLLARTAARHCMEGMGEGKLDFPLFKTATRQKGPFAVSELILSPIALSTLTPLR